MGNYALSLYHLKGDEKCQLISLSYSGLFSVWPFLIAYYTVVSASVKYTCKRLRGFEEI